MPFKSEAQRRYLWMHEPGVAQKWADEYPGQGPKNLPMHVKEPAKAMRRGAMLASMRSKE